jgi:hypothetical protein
MRMAGSSPIGVRIRIERRKIVAFVVVAVRRGTDGRLDRRRAGREV